MMIDQWLAVVLLFAFLHFLHFVSLVGIGSELRRIRGILEKKGEENGKGGK